MSQALCVIARLSHILRSRVFNQIERSEGRKERSKNPLGKFMPIYNVGKHALASDNTYGVVVVVVVAAAVCFYVVVRII